MEIGLRHCEWCAAFDELIATGLVEEIDGKLQLTPLGSITADEDPDGGHA